MTSTAPTLSVFERYNVSKDDPRFRLGNPANLKVLIPIIYGVPLLLFYVLVIAVIQMRLKASFYRIFAIVGLTDIAAWFTALIFRRAHSTPFMFPFYEAMPTEGLFITLPYFWDYYNGYAQQAAIFFLALNRFTAVWRPAGHRKVRQVEMLAVSSRFQMWKRLLYVVYVVVPVFPLPFTWFIWLSDVQIELEHEDNYWDGYRWDGFTKPFGLRKSMFNVPISLAHGLLLLAMNLSVLAKLYVMRRQMSNSYQSSDDKRDTDAKLCIMTLILFAYSAVYTTVTTIFYFTNNNVPGWAIDLLYSIQSFGLDIHVLTAPWFLMLMSTAVRVELRSLIFRVPDENSGRLFSMATRSNRSHVLASARSNDSASPQNAVL